MSFFQNLFNSEFRGNWNLDDKKYSLTFTCPGNVNSSNYQIAHKAGNWNLTGKQVLTLNYACDSEFKNYSTLSINVAGSNPSNTKPLDVCNALNSNGVFSSMFTAQVKDNIEGASVLITAKTNRAQSNIKLWVSNSGAEELLGFNKKAGVAELPSYFARHTIANRSNYPDSTGQLILLNENNPVDQAIIRNAGFAPENMKQDWELVAGRANGVFTFQKITVDESDRITQIIEYPTGSKSGSFARKINYTYTDANINPSSVTETPHVLTNGDLIAP